MTMIKLSSNRYQTYANLERCVGNTPLYEIKHIAIQNRNRIFAKEEYLNPTGSHFDRVYPHLFKIAEEKGIIVPGITPIIEASTGNAGASFAWCARELGYTDCTVITHQDTPNSRIEQMQSFGAKIILSDPKTYVAGYVKKLEEILQKDKESIGGRIGSNPKRMYCVTKITTDAREPFVKYVNEVLTQMPITHIDYFISGVGSGTTISGIGNALKKYGTDTQIIAIEPAETPVISALKNKHEQHFKRQPIDDTLLGVGALDLDIQKLDIDFSIIDEIRRVSILEWKDIHKKLQIEEKKFVGRSSAAELAAALSIAKDVSQKNFLITFHDPSWKYDDTFPEKFKI